MTHDLRLLTFDRYETYLGPLTKTGHHWDVVVSDRRLRLEPWQAARLYGDRARLIGPAEAGKRLERGDYDAVLCHGPQDLAAVADVGIPTITLFHGTLELAAACGFDRRAFLRRFGQALERSRRVFASPGLGESWGFTGAIIAPAIDTEAAGPYEGDLRSALAVTDFEATRALLAGADSIERTLAGVPVTLMGINPPASLLRPSAETRTQAYRRYQVFVNLTHAPYDGGCPIALAEAMATGMPIVTVAGGITPIVDQVSGLVAETIDGVRERCLALLEERTLAIALGCAARETARQAFSPAVFVAKWQAVLGGIRHGVAHDAARTEVHAASR